MRLDTMELRDVSFIGAQREREKEKEKAGGGRGGEILRDACCS